MALPDNLITAKMIANGSISPQRSLGPSPSSASQERLIQCNFPTADAPRPFFHGLGRVPSGFIVTASAKGAAVGGKVYSDFPIKADTRNIVLKCDTAGTDAMVIVR